MGRGRKGGRNEVLDVMGGWAGRGRRGGWTELLDTVGGWVGGGTYHAGKGRDEARSLVDLRGLDVGQGLLAFRVAVGGRRVGGWLDKWTNDWIGKWMG